MALDGVVIGSLRAYVSSRAARASVIRLTSKCTVIFSFSVSAEGSIEACGTGGGHTCGSRAVGASCALLLNLSGIEIVTRLCRIALLLVGVGWALVAKRASRGYAIFTVIVGRACFTIVVSVITSASRHNVTRWAHKLTTTVTVVRLCL